MLTWGFLLLVFGLFANIILLCNNFDMFIHAFGVTPESQIAVVKSIFGEIPFEGHFPYEAPWEED